MAGRAAVSKELSTEEDARLLKVLSDDLYDIVLYQMDWDTVLSSLVKSGFVSEKSQKKLEKKTQGDAAAVFLALLKFSEFHSDVWIKLPHCLSFIEGPLCVSLHPTAREHAL